MEMWFSEFHTPDVKHSIRVDRQLYSKQSAYQRIDIFETPEFGRVLTLDGNVMLTERDEFIYDEMITHVPMSVHRSAKDILVIGAGDGGVQVAVGQIGVQPQPRHRRRHRRLLPSFLHIRPSCYEFHCTTVMRSAGRPVSAATASVTARRTPLLPAP